MWIDRERDKRQPLGNTKTNDLRHPAYRLVLLAVSSSVLYRVTSPSPPHTARRSHSGKA